MRLKQDAVAAAWREEALRQKEELRAAENRVKGVREVKNRPTCSAKIMQVIQVMNRTGDGSQGNPNRIVLEFWSLEGELLAVSDPCEDKGHGRKGGRNR